MEYYIGIDPGAKGAMAIIDESENVNALIDWPGDEVSTARIVRDLISRVERISYFYGAIEKAQSMPKQGVKSMFNYGANFGIWRGILAAEEIPFILVHPKTWQKNMFSHSGDKKPAMAAAARLFPKAEIYGPKGGKKDGRADALLIAYWCKKQRRK